MKRSGIRDDRAARPRQAPKLIVSFDSTRSAAESGIPITPRTALRLRRRPSRAEQRPAGCIGAGRTKARPRVAVPGRASPWARKSRIPLRCIQATRSRLPGTGVTRVVAGGSGVLRQVSGQARPSRTDQSSRRFLRTLILPSASK